MSPIPSTTSTAATAANATGAVTSSSVQVDQNMFLQLLVAQLQNQDPLQPMDSSTFVTQLAQFQQLESTVNMGEDITGIRSDADQLLADYSADKPSADATSGGTSGTNPTTQP